MLFTVIIILTYITFISVGVYNTILMSGDLQNGNIIDFANRVTTNQLLIYSIILFTLFIIC